MPATIRLKRIGRKKQAAFRIVVAEKSTAVTGPSIERLGIYQPRTDPSVVKLDAGRTLHWLHSGAMPTDSARSLLQRVGLWEKYHQGVQPEELAEEDRLIFVGPAEGRQKTSVRAEAAEQAAKEAEEAAAAEAEAVAEAQAEPEVTEPPVDEVAEEPEDAPEEESAAEEEPAAEADEEPAAEADAEAEEEPADEAEDDEEEPEAEDVEESEASEEGDEEDEEKDEG